MPITKLHRYLATEDSLQRLVLKANQIRSLAKQCRDFLPKELALYTEPANIKNGQLVVLAANSAVAAKLKMLSGSLCEFLSAQGSEVNSVSVRVQPGLGRRINESDVTTQKQAVLTSSQLADLANLYEKWPDSEARAALGKIIGRHQSAAKPGPVTPCDLTVPKAALRPKRTRRK